MVCRSTLLQVVVVAGLLGAVCSVSTKVPCVPGELVFVDCNLCTCNKEGMPNQVCARMWCPPPPKSQTTTTTAAPDEQESKGLLDAIEAAATTGKSKGEVLQ